MSVSRSVMAALAVFYVSPVAADQSLLGIARSVTLMTAISKFCPGVIPTDRDRAERYASAFKDVGLKSASADVWTATLTAEAKRRFAEVQATGAQRWCGSQRRSLREMGARDVFP